MNQDALDIENLFAGCSQIAFHVNGKDDDQRPLIILGFDDRIYGSMAYSALQSWAKDDELVATVSRKNDHIDATLIHTSKSEIVNVGGLAFNQKEMNDFIKKVAQDRPLGLTLCINPLSGYNLISQLDGAAQLTLIRYIVMQPS